MKFELPASRSLELEVIYFANHHPVNASRGTPLKRAVASPTTPHSEKSRGFATLYYQINQVPSFKIRAKNEYGEHDKVREFTTKALVFECARILIIVQAAAAKKVNTFPARAQR